MSFWAMSPGSSTNGHRPPWAMRSPRSRSRTLLSSGTFEVSNHLESMIACNSSTGHVRFHSHCTPVFCRVAGTDRPGPVATSAPAASAAARRRRWAFGAFRSTNAACGTAQGIARPGRSHAERWRHRPSEMELRGCKQCANSSNALRPLLCSLQGCIRGGTGLHGILAI